MTDIRQNTAFNASVYMQTPAGAGLPGVAGSLVINLKKPGAGFNVITPAVTDRSGGWYELALTASHTDTVGINVFNITAPEATPNNELQLNVVAVTGSDVVSSLSTVNSDLTTTSSSVTGVNNSVNSVNADIATVNADLAAVNSDITSVGSQISGIDTAVGNVDSAVGGVSSALVTTSANVATVGSQVTSVGSTVSSLSSSVSGVSVSINNVAADMTALNNSLIALPTTILGALMSDNAITGTVGDGIAVGAGILQGNYFMDNVVQSANGPISARMRIFRTGAATAAATSGGSGEGEFATFIVTTIYTGPNKIRTHRVVRQ